MALSLSQTRDASPGRCVSPDRTEDLVGATSFQFRRRATTQPLEATAAVNNTQAVERAA